MKTNIGTDTLTHEAKPHICASWVNLLLQQVLETTIGYLLFLQIMWEISIRFWVIIFFQLNQMGVNYLIK